MSYSGPERRKTPRIPGKFVVSYRVKADIDNVDISQTRNLSLGGMILTTNKGFPIGTLLALSLRLPFFVGTIGMTGRVQATKEVAKDLIYDTHIQFIAVDTKAEGIINDTINYYLKEKK